MAPAANENQDDEEAETKPKPPVEPQRSNPATIKHTSLLLTNEPVADTLPPVDQLDQNVQIGLQNKAGDSILSDVPPPSNHGVGRSVEPVVSEPPLEESAISITAEIMPEFPGGQAAFTRFLSKNLRVPENSMDPGQQIRIVVRFVVGKEGEISDFVFL